MVDVAEILELHRVTVGRWHREPVSNFAPGFLHVVCDQHMANFRLWHEEDLARSRDATDAQIAQVKRNIDKLNQQRNDLIEKVDEWLLADLAAQGIAAPDDAPLNTETPGSTIDRLSILSLRIFHLDEERTREDATAEHKQKVASRLAICQQQRTDLGTALAQLVDAIYAGSKRLRVYRQLKMYNDPTLNPVLYRGGQTVHARAA